MFKFKKSIDLPPQLNWRYANEPELLSWTIKARDYDTLIANTAICITSLLALSFAIFTYIINEGDPEPGRTLWSINFFVMPTLGLWYGLGQTVNVAYRFSKSGWEYCKWKDTPKWHLTMVKWATAVILVMFLALAALDPIFMLGALIGPAGMALTYLSMANSESYQQLETQYNHLAFTWSETKQLAIVKNREAVNIKRKTWETNIFCKPGQKEIVAQFIRSHLSPDVPCVRAKVDTIMDIQEGEPI